MKPFLLLTFTLTWTYWIPCALERLGLLPWSLPEAVPVLAGLATLGPAVAALVVIGRARGRAGTAALLRSLGHRRVGGRWLLAGAVVYPLLLLAAGGLANAFAGAGLAPQPLSAGGRR